MKAHTNTNALQHEVEALEDRLQLVKWSMIASTPRRLAPPTRAPIVERTAGLLSKRFPTGIRYERRIRQSWGKRLRRLGL